MPQAMPLNWLSLYILFIIIFFIISIKLYYTHFKNPNQFKLNYKKKMNWKW